MFVCALFNDEGRTPAPSRGPWLFSSRAPSPPCRTMSAESWACERHSKLKPMLKRPRSHLLHLGTRPPWPSSRSLLLRCSVWRGTETRPNRSALMSESNRPASSAQMWDRLRRTARQSCQEMPHQPGNVTGRFIEREVACIEQMYFRFRHIPLERRGRCSRSQLCHAGKAARLLRKS